MIIMQIMAGEFESPFILKALTESQTNKNSLELKLEL